MMMGENEYAIRTVGELAKLAKVCRKIDLQETERKLIIYASAIKKSKLLLGSWNWLKKADNDVFNYLRTELFSLKSSDVVSFILPKIYNLEGIEDTNYNILKDVKIFENTQSNVDLNIFLADCGRVFMLFIRKNADFDLMNSILEGYNEGDDLTHEVLLRKSTSKLKNLVRLIAYLRENKSKYTELLVIIEGSEFDKALTEILLDDFSLK